jgi:hypothetical protein
MATREPVQPDRETCAVCQQCSHFRNCPCHYSSISNSRSVLKILCDLCRKPLWAPLDDLFFTLCHTRCGEYRYQTRSLATSCLRLDTAPPQPWRTRRGHVTTGRVGSESRFRLRRIEVQNGGRFFQAVKERFEQVLHRLEHIIQKHRSHALPKPTFAAKFGPHRLEQRAAELLGLID